jgi:putative CocE/NonD family hydrolase
MDPGYFSVVRRVIDREDYYSAERLATIAILIALPISACITACEDESSKTISANSTIQEVGELDDRFPAAEYPTIRLEKSVRVTMRDGVKLSTDLYFPIGSNGPYPVILIRTPYGKNETDGFRRPGSIAHFFAGQGYVVAVQDTRGRYESEGNYLVSAADRNDGYDTVEWLAKQSWSTGKIGSYGCSYLGESQIQLAAARPPHLEAIIPRHAGGAYVGTHRPFGAFDGGVPELASSVSWFWQYGSKEYRTPDTGLSDSDFQRISDQFDWGFDIPELPLEKALRHLPVIDILREFEHGLPTDFELFASRAPGDNDWSAHNYVDEADLFDVPAIHVSSWFDATVDETLRLFNLFRDNSTSGITRDNQFAIISPATHCATEALSDSAVVGEREVSNASMDYFGIYLKWFDFWLKGEAHRRITLPKVQYYLMGANVWRSSDSWPPDNAAPKAFFLHSKGSAGTQLQDGMLSLEMPEDDPADRFIYDPGNPVPSIGGPSCCTDGEGGRPGSFDQARLESRADVLVYTSEPLARGLEVTGPIEAILFVSSTAKDTDFTVKLIDVYPDGRAFNVQEGILRARYRQGYERPEFMQPGNIYRLAINLHAVANYFGRGHQIRIQISSSNFPRFVRNLNTGGSNYDETEFIIAENSIYHDRDHPSHIVLSVITQIADQRETD